MNREVTMPQLGFTMVEGTVAEWRKREGEAIVKGEALLEVTTDKVSIDVEAPFSGSLSTILVAAGATVPVGTPICLVADGSEAAGASVEGSRIRASGLARRLARENGVNLAIICGSGPSGRILEADVRKAISHQPSAVSPESRVLSPIPSAQPSTQDSALSTGLSPQPSVLSPVSGRRVPFAGNRRIVGERMFQSVHSTAQVTLVAEVDATEALRLRSQLLPEWEREGIRLTLTDLIVKACGKALREHPYVNAKLDGDQILLLDQVNVGIAVALSDGLIVPVVRGADSRPLREIAAESRALAERARAGRLSVDDVSGGTFTVTNLGSYGIDLFTPIINAPETAILGVGKAVERPAVYNGDICKRSLMYLSLSFDHRLIDGAPAAEFMQRVRELLERPYLLLA